MPIMKRHILTISGMPGSGKSSTGDAIANMLGYHRFSSGDFMRQIAEYRGVSLDELQKIAEGDRSIDTAIDEEIKKVAVNDNLIIDSRLAYHWIPDAYKVYLTLDPHIAAERIFNHIKSVGRIGQSAGTADEIYTHMLARIESEKKRYRENYNLDYTNENNFDLVVDTGKHTLIEVVKIVIDAYNAWLMVSV
jgi:cytidylate kinase